MLQLFGTQQVTLCKNLEVSTQVSNQNCSSKTKLTWRKTAQILPLSSRLMCNKVRFVHKVVSGRAPIYLSTKLLINQSSRNSSRKLNVPIPRINLFKSSLVYSGPALWNSLPSELRLPVSPSVFKKRLTLHMLSLLRVTWNHDHRCLYLFPCAVPTCVVLLHAAHTFCVSVLYVHVVFDDKHVLNLMCMRVCIYVYPRSS